MLIGIIVTLLCVHQSRSSVVIDAVKQKGLHLSQYCPKTQHCPEGSHVMCMYYNPNRVMGPRCSNPQNVSMTPDIATKLLEVSNAVRSRIALGKEVGNNGPLPRGYGIFRLSWDEELATFAQVLANQCVLTRDLCRATKKYPDPGQAIGLVRFTYPDWLPVSNKSYFTTTDLSQPKLNYAITQTMKTWYSQKKYVTPEMILNYPDFQQSHRSQFGKLYLKMIHGPATHMGCGISAYTQFAYYDNNSPLNYNVVCNYSAKPGTGLQVYTTTPPTQIGYTVKCGCPEGYDEDADCLCFESRIQPLNPPPQQSFCADDSCKQSVVLLPIFTVEDAPPHKLIPSGFNNNSLRIGQSDEMFQRNKNYKSNIKGLEPKSLNEFTKLLRGSDIARSTNHQKSSLIEGRFENRKPTNKKHTARQSIFSRAQKFQLPTRKVFASYRVVGKEIKKDVAPRKDFSNVQKLLKTYLNTKRNHVGNMFKGKNYEYTSNEPLIPKEIDVHVTGNLIKKNKVINPNRFVNTYSKQDFVYGDFNTTKEIKEFDMARTNENSDKKLIALLNNLELEVKHIELDPTEKEIFDSRIRKIYDRVVGKHDFELKPIQLLANDKKLDKEINENLINYETAADNEFINKRRVKSEASESHKLNVYDDTGLVKRNQNSIRSTDKHYRNVFTDYKNEESNTNNLYTTIDKSDDDHISYDRRKYYQDKLDNLQRKLQTVRTHRGHVNSPRHVLPVRPTKISSKMQLRASKPKPTETFYIPDRARFIHGF